MNTESKIYEYENECIFKSLVCSKHKTRFGEIDGERKSLKVRLER